MDCWDQRPKSIPQEKWDRLRELYLHPHHIDLFVGGLAEEPIEGGLTGPVFQNIKARQFKALKEGDRFFFTHKGQVSSFTKSAQKHIKRRGLADIICDNTGAELIAKNPFKIPSKNNKMIACKNGVRKLKLKKINLIGF